MYLKFRIQGGGLRWRPYAQPSFPLGELEGAKDLFLEYIFAKFGVMRVFFRFVGRFFEIKTLPLHKNNGDVLPSLWV